MALRRPPSTFSDDIVASDLAANSVTSSELADNAVDTAAIATNAVTATEIAAGAVGSSEIATNAVTSSELASAVTSGSVILTGVKPHIITDMLYPAVANIMMDGTTALSAVTTGPNSSTVTSSKYGTVQSDGRMYYYTDIKGSKPIKDPRIGSHFGSQRYNFSSIQVLEQETATHGQGVYSIDGREWMRAVGRFNMVLTNNSNGLYLPLTTTGDHIEITGYFNNANIKLLPASDQDNFALKLNGTSLTANNPGITVGSPLAARFLSAGALINVSFSTTPTLGINTIVIQKSDWLGLYGIELIAQDVSSDANKSKVQIPSQNVVSFGKKFTVAETKHHNPFAFKTNGSTAWASGDHNSTAWPIGTGSSTNIDTATSLGLVAWVSTNYYKPYNGGRVVKWVASDGTIKTSVNMMPPNARSIANSASLANGNAKANASIANNTFYPTFEATAIDTSLAEIAKTFHYGEFGNGAANGNASWKDGTTMTSADTQNVTSVMDDGLTSISGSSVYADAQGGHRTLIPFNNNDYYQVTFIGTGVTIKVEGGYGTGTYNLAQNLPYGTHVLKVYRTSNHPTYTIDGVSLGQISNATYGGFTYMTFHQPKLPPIPEDAVIISDYMLMADFVGITASTSVVGGLISKGTRFASPSRDFKYNTPTGSFTFLASVSAGYPTSGFAIYAGSGNISQGLLPFFGVNADQSKFQDRTKLCFDAETSESGITKPSSVTSTWYNHNYKATNLTVGVHTLKHLANNNHWNHGDTYIASPIHTSSHYQTFEGPYLNELVGGDRNMEQNNLVVTPDGKTWEQFSSPYKPSYPKAGWHLRASDKAAIANGVPYNKIRGIYQNHPTMQKNCIVMPIDGAGGNLIIQVTGWYQLSFNEIPHSNQGSGSVIKFWYKNAVQFLGHGLTNRGDVADPQEVSCTVYLEKGDKIHGSHYWNTFNTSSFFSGTYLGT